MTFSESAAATLTDRSVGGRAPTRSAAGARRSDSSSWIESFISVNPANPSLEASLTTVGPLVPAARATSARLPKATFGGSFSSSSAACCSEGVSEPAAAAKRSTILISEHMIQDTHWFGSFHPTSTPDYRGGFAVSSAAIRHMDDGLSRLWVDEEVAPGSVHGLLARHVLADGYKLVVDLDRSHGCRLVDARDGSEYLDCYSFFASLPIWLQPPGPDRRRVPRETRSRRGAQAG